MKGWEAVRHVDCAPEGCKTLPQLQAHSCFSWNGVHVYDRGRTPVRHKELCGIVAAKCELLQRLARVHEALVGAVHPDLWRCIMIPTTPRTSRTSELRLHDAWEQALQSLVNASEYPLAFSTKTALLHSGLQAWALATLVTRPDVTLRVQCAGVVCDALRTGLGAWASGVEAPASLPVEGIESALRHACLEAAAYVRDALDGRACACPQHIRSAALLDAAVSAVAGGMVVIGGQEDVAASLRALWLQFTRTVAHLSCYSHVVSFARCTAPAWRVMLRTPGTWTTAYPHPYPPSPHADVGGDVGGRLMKLGALLSELPKAYALGFGSSVTDLVWDACGMLQPESIPCIARSLAGDALAVFHARKDCGGVVSDGDGVCHRVVVADARIRVALGVYSVTQALVNLVELDSAEAVCSVVLDTLPHLLSALPRDVEEALMRRVLVYLKAHPEKCEEGVWLKTHLDMVQHTDSGPVLGFALQQVLDKCSTKKTTATTLWREYVRVLQLIGKCLRAGAVEGPSRLLSQVVVDILLLESKDQRLDQAEVQAFYEEHEEFVLRHAHEWVPDAATSKWMDTIPQLVGRWWRQEPYMMGVLASSVLPRTQPAQARDVAAVLLKWPRSRPTPAVEALLRGFVGEEDPISEEPCHRDKRQCCVESLC
jgi:hypothetical protein